MSGAGIISTDGTKTKTKRFKVKHPKRKLYRSSEPLLSVFMWGINHTVKELEHVSIPVMLMPDDFRAFSKVKVDNQAFNKENLPSHFKVKDYCPLVFRNLRERFGIDDQDYLRSMTKDSPKPMDSPGRSGAKFYASHDKLFVIKTLTSEEVEQMHSLLKQYHPFIVERHGKTLLPQYLGMYRITVDNNECYMVVMRNIFSSHLNIHKKYDLKGSTIDREASQKEREKDNPTFKDNDFINDGVKIHIGDEAKQKLMETLAADVEFLAKLHIMDYSLLLGVHDCEEAEREAAERGTVDLDGVDEEVGDEEYDSGGSGVALTPPDSPQAPSRSQSVNGASRIDPEKDIYAIPSRSTSQSREIYFLALVDVLTHYGVKKQAAKVAKTVKYGAGVDGISTAEPDQYSSRFLEFISKAIE
ncbi:hypothetical protein TCAL_05498 [Tigriopus californicus]|uniref:1-phosphatidylinositol-5-phosphate 4-kinase n=1 Tax=Tigriopus californicus TaxID=6832 RepID=A0A553NNZ7_TIGCA|nr:phosphatidylinositol 5-phosphate 4-kinase type-2 alpha-like [Tigriopus californicus]TRY67162.1 hypothetical protein TCAL_05498 [Tigriopus californicus]